MWMCCYPPGLAGVTWPGLFLAVGFRHLLNRHLFVLMCWWHVTIAKGLVWQLLYWQRAVLP